MTEYRGVTITCEKTGSFKGAGGSQSIIRCKAKVGTKNFKGTLEEVKKKIDTELGPEDSDSTNTD